MPGNVFCLTFTNKATENLILKMRRALRTLDLDEGEEPEISNYHAFAAQVLERHGMLIGLEPGQRVLSQAQRADRGTGAGPDDVRDAAHSVAARDCRLHPRARRAAPEPPRRAGDGGRARRGQARRAPQGAVRGAAPGRRGAGRDRPRRPCVPRHQGGARRDRLRRPDRARGPHRVGVPGRGPGLPRPVRSRVARRVPGHEPRAGGADARRVRGRSPGDGRRRPRSEHLRVARREPVEPAALPQGVPALRRVRVRAAPAVHQLPLGRSDPAGGRQGDRRAAGEPASRSGQAPAPVGTQRRRTRRGRPVRARGGGGRGCRRTRARAPRERGRVEGHGGPVPDAPALRGVAARVRRDGGARRVREPRRADPPPRDRRGARVRAGNRGPERRCGAREDPDGPEISGRSPRPRRTRRLVTGQGSQAPGSTVRSRVRRGRRPVRGSPFLMAEAWRISMGFRDSPTRDAPASPGSETSSTSSAWRRDVPSASSWPRSSAGPACSPSSTPPRTGRWRSRNVGTSPRSSSRCTRSNRSTASSRSARSSTTSTRSTTTASGTRCSRATTTR